MTKHLYEIFTEKWGPCGQIFIYSDPHFSDFDSYRYRHLVKIPDKRDYFNTFKDGDIFETYETCAARLVKQADEEQVKRINAVCGKSSTLIILGDIGNIEYVKKLKAKHKILIMGNHDKGASNYKRHIEYHVDEEHGSLEYDLMNKLVKEDNHLFDEIYEGPLFISEKILLSHEPLNVPNVFNIHGHIHDKNCKGDDTHLNVCAEAIDYKPINLSSFIKSGALKKVKDIHRQTVDNAIARKKAKK